MLYFEFVAPAFVLYEYPISSAHIRSFTVSVPVLVRVLGCTRTIRSGEGLKPGGLGFKAPGERHSVLDVDGLNPSPGFNTQG